MAVDAFAAAWSLTPRRHPILCVRKARLTKSTVTIEPESDTEARLTFEWEKLSSKELGIKMTSISNSTKLVLSALRKNGHEVYLVGGCVRDLILKRTPKDFDIITSAQLTEVRRTFPVCEIVGKRFPICHVHVNHTTIEVSSFSTSERNFSDKLDKLRRPPGCNRNDYIRWRNCLSRDFTINGLMFDPYAKLVYDYTGGMQDIRKSKMRTVIPANISFVEDCARILRAVRIAARLGFKFTKDIALSLKELSGSVRRLDKGRILVEMNYMMAYGSSEASMRLLWRFGLLETLLPIQASYFASQGFRRRDERSNMLLSLLSNLDKFVAPNQPCHNSLWIALLAFHKALTDKPREPLVVAALCIVISGGVSLSGAVEIAKTISQPHNRFDELLEPSHKLSEKALVSEAVDLTVSITTALRKMTDRDYVSQAMIKFPKAPRSDLVFIPMALVFRVCKIFDCVKRESQRRLWKDSGPKVSEIFRSSDPRIGKRTDYEHLALGILPEVQSVFATIVINTIYPAKP